MHIYHLHIVSCLVLETGAFKRVMKALFRLMFFSTTQLSCVRCGIFSENACLAEQAELLGAGLLEMHVWSTTYLNKHIAVLCGLVGN